MGIGSEHQGFWHPTETRRQADTAHPDGEDTGQGLALPLPLLQVKWPKDSLVLIKPYL